MRAMGLAALTALALAGGAAAQERAFRFLSVGAGELDGGYYAVAGAICEAVNTAERGWLRCSREATPGSRYNVESLLSDELDFALVQSDILDHAYAGRAIYAGRPPQSGLRRVARLYVETVTILARPEAGVLSQRDLGGKRVDIGPPASGRNATTRALLSALDLDLSFFGETTTLQSAAAIEALCAGRIDAAIFVIGHPSALVSEALARCGARVAPMQGPAVAALNASAPYFTPGVIPKADYPTLAADVPSIGVAAILAAGADMPDAVVEAVTAAMLDRLPALSRATPLLARLDPDGMRRGAGAAPLHDGAAAAYAAAAE